MSFATEVTRDQFLARESAAPRPKKREDIRCPFCGASSGAGGDESDELGYCDHLVGFTNDGRTMEARLTVGTKAPGCREYVGARSRTSVTRRFVIVPALGPTSRVYYKNGLAPYQSIDDIEGLGLDDIPELPESARTMDVDAVMAMMADTQALVREQSELIGQLRAELNAIKKKRAEDATEQTSEAGFLT